MFFPLLPLHQPQWPLRPSRVEETLIKYRVPKSKSPLFVRKDSIYAQEKNFFGKNWAFSIVCAGAIFWVNICPIFGLFWFILSFFNHFSGLNLFRCPRFYDPHRVRMRTTSTPKACKNTSIADQWPKERRERLVEASPKKERHKKTTENEVSQRWYVCQRKNWSARITAYFIVIVNEQYYCLFPI